MKKYIRRIVDNELDNALDYAGAVIIRGPKSCGKTRSALQHAQSVLRVDTDNNVVNLMAIDPKALLKGETPRLLDEWQVQPKLWDYVRHEVDDRSSKGQFILTGSSTPDEYTMTHSGAGRFAVVPMRTLTWQELGYSDSHVSLDTLFENNSIIDTKEYKISIQEIIKRLVIGGWPELANVDEAGARKINASYIKLLTEVDMSRISNIKRNPHKVRRLLQSIARNVSTTTEVTTFIRDIQSVDNEELSRPTVTDYLNALERLMVIEDQPAWNTHIRSSAALRKTPKRHFSDVSLAVAALGLDSASLYNDLSYTGFLFESQVIHDLRVYAQTFDAEVYFYRDSSGLEVDAIVQKPNGEAAAFEIKLGEGFVNIAAKNLLTFAEKLDKPKVKITSLNVITGSGYAYSRPDGVNVMPLGALGVQQVVVE